MKVFLRTSLTLATLAASIPCQLQEASPKERLDYAAVVETSEGRLDRAEELYRGLLDDQSAKNVHADAALRLGRLLWALDRRDEARPLLERAATAGGKTAEQAAQLLASSGQDAQRDKESEKKAEALVSRMSEILSRYTNGQPVAEKDERSLQALRTELLWLGAPAARVVARQCQVVSQIARDDGRLRTLSPQLSYFYNLLWTIGHEPARAFLLKVAESGPLPQVRFAAANASAQGKDMVDVFAAFARNNDPTGETWRNLDKTARLLGVRDILALTSNQHPAAQALGLSAAGHNWRRFSETEREVFFSMHRPRLEEALASQMAPYRKQAQNLLTQMVVYGPRAGTELFLEAAATLPQKETSFSMRQRDQFAVRANDAWIAKAASTAKQLGRHPKFKPGFSPKGATTGIVVLLEKMEIAWTASAYDDVITLVELGYLQEQPRWLEDVYEQATPAQMARVIRALPDQWDPQKALRVLGKRDGDPTWFDAYREALQRCFDDTSVTWRGGMRDGQVYWREEVVELMRLGAKAAPDRAPAWIIGVAKSQLRLMPRCMEVLLLMSQANEVSGRTALRSMLAQQTDRIDRNGFDELFRECVRSGDELAIPLLAQHYGTAWVAEIPTVQNGSSRNARNNSRTPPRRIDPLCRGEIGYTLDAQLRLWRELVTGPHADKVWFDMCRSNLGKSRSLPVASLPALSHLLTKDDCKEFEASERLASAFLQNFSQLTVEHLERPEFEASVRQLMQPKTPRLLLITFGNLRADVAARYRDVALAALRADPRGGDLSDIAARVAIGSELWQTLLRENSYAAMGALPDARVVEFEQQIASYLEDEDSSNREQACETLIRGLGSRAAPYLLPRLRDEDKFVREFAKNKLDELRAIRQQEDFWGNASKRIDTTPASAAAKLIAQAMPDQDKAQRLLAIRSLALLGEPAALPYLIDWTTDADQDVQKAARAAITEMHGAGKAGGKDKK